MQATKCCSFRNQVLISLLNTREFQISGESLIKLTTFPFFSSFSFIYCSLVPTFFFEFPSLFCFLF